MRGHTSGVGAEIGDSLKLIDCRKSIACEGESDKRKEQGSEHDQVLQRGGVRNLQRFILLAFSNSIVN